MNGKIFIREYKKSDCREITELFYNTIHSINAKDYSEKQLDVWAVKNPDIQKWDESLKEHFSFTAVKDNLIVGFGDIDKTGYLDRLYVHKDYQGMGIATALCDKLESMVQGKITVHASVTAKPFFEKRGYKAIKKQQVERQKILLTNFIMEKLR